MQYQGSVPIKNEPCTCHAQSPWRGTEQCALHLSSPQRDSSSLPFLDSQDFSSSVLYYDLEGSFSFHPSLLSLSFVSQNQKRMLTKTEVNTHVRCSDNNDMHIILTRNIGGVYFELLKEILLPNHSKIPEVG